MWTWNIMKLSSSCKRKTKQRTYPSQLAYKHHYKLFGCWNLGIMEHFLWMQPLVPMCKGTIFSPRWCLTIIVKVYRSSMGNHKSANKIGLNTMVVATLALAQGQGKGVARCGPNSRPGSHIACSRECNCEREKL